MSTNKQKRMVECLEVLEGTRRAFKQATSDITELFREMLLVDLSPGSIIDTSDPETAYRAKVLMGHGYRETFKLIGPLTLDIDPSRPSLSKWNCHAISWDIEKDKPVGKQVTLRGHVFPTAFMNLESPEATFILEQVKKLEARLEKL